MSEQPWPNPRPRSPLSDPADDLSASTGMPTEDISPSDDDGSNVVAPSSSFRADSASWPASYHEAPLPEQVGPYRILARLGEGGIGIVYKAEQREPVKRIVALKLIKLGMDTREVVARFAAERQALAMMDHPNVARVFDAGSTTTGRPYFVMELVAGEPITEYCDRHSLTTRQRLELFQQVCAAVQHAHTKGIIHRDLKPSNILVAVKDGQPLAKVIDFGIAKAISSRLSEHTLYTEQGQLIGTPEYMSPEQAEMSAVDVDTRTDVYSLGVMLYELLAGATPFDSKTLRAQGYGEIQRTIREVDPPPPSTRLTRLGDRAQKVAEQRRSDLADLAAELRRELEWIPLKAMRKDRTERYQTAKDLATDIQNYLHGLPLMAGPETTLYRARKFFRRNQLAVAVVGALILSLSAALTSTLMMLKDRAQSSLKLEQQVAETQKALAESKANEQRALAMFEQLQAKQTEVTRANEAKRTAELDRAEQERLRRIAEARQQAAEQQMQRMSAVVSGAWDQFTPDVRRELLATGVTAVGQFFPAARLINEAARGAPAASPPNPKLPPGTTLPITPPPPPGSPTK